MNTLFLMKVFRPNEAEEDCEIQRVWLWKIIQMYKLYIYHYS